MLLNWMNWERESVWNVSWISWELIKRNPFDSEKYEKHFIRSSFQSKSTIMNWKYSVRKKKTPMERTKKKAFNHFGMCAFIHRDAQMRTHKSWWKRFFPEHFDGFNDFLAFRWFHLSTNFIFIFRFFHFSIFFYFFHFSQRLFFFQSVSALFPEIKNDLSRIRVDKNAFCARARSMVNHSQCITSFRNKFAHTKEKKWTKQNKNKNFKR